MRPGPLVMLAWLAAGPALAAEADELALGKALFTGRAAPACAVCHTLKDAGSAGEIGPVLDEIKPTRERVLTALRNGVGLMPSYKDTLTEAEIRALARYVSTVAGR